jgi:hypothetical protein
MPAAAQETSRRVGTKEQRDLLTKERNVYFKFQQGTSAPVWLLGSGTTALLFQVPTHKKLN